MARPLTRTRKDGTPYTREAAVEAQIDEVLALTPEALQGRLLITQPQDPAYLRSETLVHLMRHGMREHRRSRDQRLVNAVLPVLSGRCERTVRVKVSGLGIGDPASLRQEILNGLSELFVRDGSAQQRDRLDYYECKFNHAFRTWYLDARRREALWHERHVDLIDEPPEESEDPRGADPMLIAVTLALRTPPTQEDDVQREEILKAVEALPSKERAAFTLVHIMGYKIDSNDPGEVTAATRCHCDGRTIRNRLQRAAARLRSVLGDL